jgi:hypothetical protein
MGGLRLGYSSGRRFRNGIAFASTSVLLALSASARAQLNLSAAAQAQRASAPLVPVVTPLRGDDLFAARVGPTASAAFAPLRLSLMSGLFPQASVFSGCASRTDASGNSVNGFASQYYGFVHLTPQLVLHGYSMMGCAVDAGIGGGLTYAVPLRNHLWLVPSAGFYALPNSLGGGAAAPVTAAARVDLVKQLGWGRTLSVGIGTKIAPSGAFNALHFGGSF